MSDLVATSSHTVASCWTPGASTGVSSNMNAAKANNVKNLLSMSSVHMHFNQVQALNQTNWLVKDACDY